MNIKNIACLVFSPTGGGLKMIKSIKESIKEYEVNIYNVTRLKKRESIIEIPKKTDYLIIAFPVYGDELPKIFKEYLNTLLVSNIPVSLIAGYGNVDQGNALYEAKTLIEKKGNIVCSACAIVAKHSYNGGRVQLAPNEPTDKKLEILNQFILKSIEKIKNADNLMKCKTNVPKGHIVLLARTPQKFIPQIYVKQPKVIQDLCTHCNVCVSVCPVGAIDNELNIDNGKCIRCLACVKHCINKARVFKARYKILEYVLIKESKNIKENTFYI